MRRAIAAGLTALVAIASAVGCGGGSGSVPAVEELVPAGANLIAQVKLAEILDDEDVAAFYESLPRDSGSNSSIISIARTFGAPETVPAGKTALNASNISYFLSKFPTT